MRPKVAIYIDYVLRIPSFYETFSNFKQVTFTELKEDLELEGDMIIRSFWKEILKDPEVENFYLKALPPEKDMDNKNWTKYFYNTEQYMKFIEDYSYNLFVDAVVPSNKDIELINIAQKYLFDIVLVDEYMSTRKKTNTFFYLSKTRVTPYSILFLKEGETLNKEDYLDIWNPKTNSEQENGENLGNFENWLKDLEFNFTNGATDK